MLPHRPAGARHLGGGGVTATRPVLLVVEDDAGLQRQLRWAYDGYEVVVAGDRAEALDALRLHEPQVVTLDLGLPPDPDGTSEGLAALADILALKPDCKVIVASGHGARESALAAIAGGAWDFYQKPIDIDQLGLIVARAFHVHALEAENRRLAEAPAAGLGGLVTAAPEMLAVTRTIERVRAELGWEFIQIYGLTETAPLITMNRFRSEWADLDDHQQARMLGRAGAPAIGVRVSIAEDGEVLTQSNTNLDGYWDQPEATTEALAGNWFHTGDRGSMSDGYLSISDRKKDIIITGGENVSSIEVEDALISHPGVREAAVVGVPDDKWGELVTAVVVISVTDPGADPPTGLDLIAHCREHLAGYKCPKRVEFVDSLPRTATGKIQKFRIRQQLARD